MKYKTFKRGGIHPPDNKLTAHCPIEELPLPAQVIVPLGMHIGAPSKALVTKGDKVKVGTLIAEASSFISAHVHSPVSGTVVKQDAFLDASGYPRQALVIQVEGDDWEPHIDRSPDLIEEFQLTKEEIIAKISQSGIVGAGGAAFPTQVKLSIPEGGPQVNTLIINGVECEPYLTTDHRIMLESPQEILMGIKVLQKALGVHQVFIGVESNKMDAIRKLVEKSLEDPDITVIPLKVQYPQGAEKQLIEALLEREVPSGQLPLATGAVVSNVGTCLAVYEGVLKNKPFVERVLTYTGPQVSGAGNYRVRVGTPLDWIIQQAGGLPEGTGKVILGGPMMGKAIGDLGIPVTKGTSGILSLRKETVPCIRCSKCVAVCPMGLEPYLLEALGTHQRFEEAETQDVMDCIECGACHYACPAHRPLLDYIRLSKRQVMNIRRARSAK